MMTKRAPRPQGNSRSEENERTLLLVNDDINSFKHVIKALVEVCGCVIKIADVSTLEEMSVRLKELSLDTVVI